MLKPKLFTHNFALLTLALVFVALAALYSAVVPLGEGPDEPGHASYVFFLARERRLPDQRKNEVPGEGHQPPLAYALAAPLAAWLPADQLRADSPGNRQFTWAGGAERNAVAHGSREYWPWRGMVLAWHLARLLSVGWGTATVLFTYLAARALICRLQTADCRLQIRESTTYNLQSTIPFLAAALVALNPQFLFMSALATNDALLTALSAALLWLVIRPPTTDGRAREVWPGVARAASIGAVLGLALITKQSAIVLAPVALLGAWDRARAPGKIGASLRRAAVSTGAMLAVAAAICGWWYARNLRLYGDLFGLAVFQAEFVTQAFDPRSPAAWLSALAQLHASFWARFGWMNVPAPGWAIGLFALLELAALAGLAAVGMSALKRSNALTFHCANARVWWPLVALPMLALAWVVSFALTAGLVAWQGRLLFPALPAIAIALAVGLSTIFATRGQGDKQTSERGRIRSLSPYLFVAALAALALWLPFGVIAPAYVWHTLPERAALARIANPVYGRLGLVGDPGAELRSWRLDGDARPGAALGLTLIWHALGRQNRSWTVFIHLVDAGEQIVAEDNTPPRGGAFPMKQWVAGDWVEDRHTLALPAGLAPGTYTLRVGLYDPRTDRRAAVFDQQGELAGDLVEVGQVTVR